MTMSKRIPTCNRSPHGWWVATLVVRFEYYGEDKSNPRRRCGADENVVLIKARGREQAYKKAVAEGRVGHGIEGINTDTRRKGIWVFEGVSSLLPVYDKLEDGAEIMWTSHQNITVGRVKSWVRKKAELEAFRDED
jgi:hypothetical protein